MSSLVDTVGYWRTHPEMRKGSSQAAALLRDDEPASFHRYLSTYDSCLQKVAEAKRRPDLIQLNDFWMNGLSQCDFLTINQLSDVSKFKLCRGKMRPTQKLVDSNSDSAVRACSTRAFALLRQKKPDIEAALAAISELKGVGVATATYITAPLCPARVPAMADEVCEAVTGAREYTLDTFRAVQRKLVGKASELNAADARAGREGEGWTAEGVGRALWSCAACTAYDVDPEEARAGTGNKQKQGSKRPVGGEGAKGGGEGRAKKKQRS